MEYMLSLSSLLLDGLSNDGTNEFNGVTLRFWDGVSIGGDETVYIANAVPYRPGHVAVEIRDASKIAITSAEIVAVSGEIWNLRYLKAGPNNRLNPWDSSIWFPYAQPIYNQPLTNENFTTIATIEGGGWHDGERIVLSADSYITAPDGYNLYLHIEAEHADLPGATLRGWYSLEVMHNA